MTGEEVVEENSEACHHNDIPTEIAVKLSSLHNTWICCKRVGQELDILSTFVGYKIFLSLISIDQITV